MKRILLILILITCTRSFSQDVAFTQSFMIPESINPSFAGFYQTTKAGLLYKNQQWSGFNFNLNSQFIYFDDWYPDLNSGIGIRANLPTDENAFIASNDMALSPPRKK